jgi:hypothetical protein
MELTTTNEPRSVDAGRGVAWWTEAWALLTKNPGVWIVMGLVLFVVMFLLGWIPFLGALIGSLLLPVFVGGWMLAVKEDQQGGEVGVGDLFACFKGPRMSALLVLGALLLAAAVVIGAIAGVLGFGAALGFGAGAGRHSGGGMMAALGVGLVTLLLVLVLGTLVSMAMWFAPALVVFRNLAPMDAVRASFAASLKNIVPFVLYGLIYIVAAIVASLLFGLGWIVLLPLTVLSAYASFKDVFGG